MKIMKILAGAVVVGGAYRLGKIVGGVKVTKFALDEFEKGFPGIKKDLAKRTSDAVINRIFDKPKKEESQ